MQTVKKNKMWNGFLGCPGIKNHPRNGVVISIDVKQNLV
jgi:hypothetical protein